MTSQSPSGQWLIAQNRHGKYCVPRGSWDRPCARAVLNGGELEQRTIEFIMRNCGDGDIVHAGTHFGDFLPALSHAASRDRTVWAFEPNPINFQAAFETCRLNELKNVELHDLALGCVREMRQMHSRAGLAELGGWASVVRTAAQFPESGLVNVSVSTLDEILPPFRKVTIVHLDVEGFEADALSGAIRTLLTWRPIVIVETYPKEWVELNLRPLGYRPIGVCHANTVVSAREDVKL